jgi:hypothetical protein
LATGAFGISEEGAAGQPRIKSSPYGQDEINGKNMGEKAKQRNQEGK